MALGTFRMSGIRVVGAGAAQIMLSRFRSFQGGGKLSDLCFLLYNDSQEYGQDLFSTGSVRRLSTAECPLSKAYVYEEHGSPDRVLNPAATCFVIENCLLEMTHLHSALDECVLNSVLKVPPRKLVDIPSRQLQDGDVCVKMLAAPINPSDINRIEGVYPIRPPMPAIAGTEGAGVVTALGSGVKSLALNDIVIQSHSTLGTWCTYSVQNESSWRKVASRVSPEYLATISINPCTAARMLQDFVSLTSGETVVQNGATSMVGQCVIQLAKNLGLNTINIVRDRPDIEDVKQRLKGLGASAVISESELESINKDLLSVWPAPRLGLNCVGGSAASAVIKLLGERGTLVTYGGMARKPVTLPTATLIFKDVCLRGFWLHKWVTEHTKEENDSMINHLLKLVEDGRLSYLMEKVSFSSFETALEKSMGKHGSVQKQVLMFD